MDKDGVLTVDHFNDTHGHTAGDAALLETARRMRGAVRAYDAFGRYGGEEFLVVLGNCDAEAAAGIAESIRQRPAGSGAAAAVWTGPPRPLLRRTQRRRP